MGKKRMGKKRKVGPDFQAASPDLTDHLLNEQSVVDELEVPEGTIPDNDEEGGTE